MNITQRPANRNNYSTGRFGYTTDLIVVHTMQGYLTGTDSWFSNPGSRVSSNYGVGLNGEVHQYVQDGDTSWANGNWAYNCRSITIELEDDNNPEGVARPDAQYASTAQLIADKCRERGIPCDRAHVIGHREVPNSNHPNCPGNADLDRLVAEANTIINAPVPGKGGGAPAPNPSGSVKVTASPFLWLRTGPGTNFPKAVGYDAQGNEISSLPNGAQVQYVNVVPGDPASSVSGSWLVSIRGHYFWAGGTTYGKGRLASLVGLLAKRS